MRAHEGLEKETIMAQFLADIAGMLELFAVAAGLVLLHRARKDAPAGLLKAAGWILVIGGVLVALCTAYYWFKYQARGDFAGASAGCPMMMEGRHMGPMHGEGSPMETPR